MKKTKGKVNHSKRVRFCQLDYYRYLATRVSSDINGIECYSCSENYIDVRYNLGPTIRYIVNEGEKQLKEVIKIINKYLGGTGDGAQQQ